MAMKTVEESHVGISCYISNLPGFRGVLKQRYSDFIVNEVDRDGQVVHLSSLDAPPEEEQRSVQETGTNTSESDTTTVTSYAALLDSFKSLAGDSDAGCLEEFLNQINTGDDKSVAPLVLSPDSNKSHRTAVHKFFKGNFKFLVTDTVDGPDASSKCIRVRLNSGGPNNNGRNSKKRKERGDKPFDSRGSKSWPENVEKFLRFHLYKENKDTQEALGVIGKMLGIQSRSFGFAGTKDKRAVSTQRVTVYKQLASRVASLNERLFGIKVGDFCYVNEGLVLGQLSGNRFTITLRGVVADSEDTIKASADALGRHGFINYFGLQRFGSGSVPTHLIGAALFRGEWELAVDMILDPRDGEKEAIAKARKYYKDGKDIEGTLRQLPRYLVAERAVLQNLKKSPGNYVQALKAIPRTLRMMYVHSYQSFLWNHAASTRVQKYGTEQVVLGDLVYCKENPTGKVTGIVGPECDDDCGDRYDSNIEEEVSEDTQEESNNYVKVVTAEDLNLGCYTIEDVILPMPGSRVIYPTNDVAKVYHDLADKDRISLMECVHNVKEFSITNVTGSYRRVFQKPINFEWELLKYADSTKPLVETDLDKIIKSKPVNGVRPVGASDAKKEDNTRELENSNDGANIEADDNEIEGEEVILPQDESVSGTNSQDFQTALKMSFTLPTSCYATMAIRELLKTSTSVAYHKTLNQ
ncbi:multisubstrate pseudouridine synthase 7 [Arachis duranensis]|uniref:Multisubstrate pseudouridine synthase 7 n=1 Tax=Arachis duranensis TaxID=130453 RepID=A0A9C6WKL1_ARADU|nr:multisubstrate pseudouridine synthase 7 [Arachis hypogaea]XP_052119312.1 multisubstrate pseudouridine synthase 7 [Arachis duranensis]QHO45512.1 Multisubstrate pseudouridine synthase [Arachis hypogaea]